MELVARMAKSGRKKHPMPTSKPCARCSRKSGGCYAMMERCGSIWVRVTFPIPETVVVVVLLCLVGNRISLGQSGFTLPVINGPTDLMAMFLHVAAMAQNNKIVPRLIMLISIFVMDA